MKKNVALSISVGLNVVLAAFLALHLAAGVSSSAPSSIASITQQGAGDARQIEQALRTAGFGEFESKQLVEALLLQRATRIASYEYWRSPPVRDAAETIAALERAAQVRAALLAAYGPGAAEDPAFSRSFRPYEREFPKFSSARQLQIGQQALERLKARSGSGAQPGFMPVSRSDAATDALEQALDPA
jgi:hypothetical protein